MKWFICFVFYKNLKNSTNIISSHQNSSLRCDDNHLSNPCKTFWGTTPSEEISDIKFSFLLCKKQFVRVPTIVNIGVYICKYVRTESVHFLKRTVRRPQTVSKMYILPLVHTYNTYILTYICRSWKSKKAQKQHFGFNLGRYFGMVYIHTQVRDITWKLSNTTNALHSSMYICMIIGLCYQSFKSKLNFDF
jgi:hypothetical protein